MDTVLNTDYFENNHFNYNLYIYYIQYHMLDMNYHNFNIN